MMPESLSLLEWVISYLEVDDEIVVPVKRMWNEWYSEHGAPPLEEFTAQVLADSRIEAMGEVDYDEGLEITAADGEQYARQMEASGYFSGPRVKLKTRDLTFEHVARMITRHNDRLEAALTAARETMPEDLDEMEEGALIHVMELAKDLRAKLREAGLDLDQIPPDDEEGE
jgi:hypothetical protein